MHATTAQTIDLFQTLARGKGVKFNDPQSIEKFFSGQAVDKVDMSEIVAIAKAVCAVTAVVCPFINAM